MTAFLVFDIGCSTQSVQHVRSAHSMFVLQSSLDLFSHISYDPNVAHVYVNKLI
jgi:hypothetical protein